MLLLTAEELSALPTAVPEWQMRCAAVHEAAGFVLAVEAIYPDGGKQQKLWYAKINLH